jgi:signal transduction histidine kinase
VRRSSWATLRTRTTILATALTAITLVAGGVALVLALQTRLTVSGDGLSRSRIDDLLALAESGQLPTTIRNIDDEGVAQVVGADGAVLAASTNIAGRPAIANVDAGPEPAVHTLEAPDDDEIEEYRVWTAEGPSPDGPVTVYVGTSLESVAEATRTLRNALLVGVPLALLLLAGALWWVLGRALRPMDRIREEVDGIDEDRLGHRVPESGVDDEVGRLATTMNRMLARLEAAQTRQRTFVADASHDLQSPLAAQRAQLEVALAHPDRADSATLGREMLATTAQMERLVRDLLFLAAAEEGATGPRPVPLDLEDVVLEEVSRARTGASVAINTSRVSAAPALADRDDVQRIVRNLLDNALAHARTTVEVCTSAEPGGARLDVVDDGRGIAEADRERIFDRFHRGDPARSRHTSGSGLGLAIARALAGRNGGTLGLATPAPGPAGAHFVLRLPATGG